MTRSTEKTRTRASDKLERMGLVMRGKNKMINPERGEGCRQGASGIQREKTGFFDVRHTWWNLRRRTTLRLLFSHLPQRCVPSG